MIPSIIPAGTMTGAMGTSLITTAEHNIRQVNMAIARQFGKGSPFAGHISALASVSDLVSRKYEWNSTDCTIFLLANEQIPNFVERNFERNVSFFGIASD